jgi:hypothetical protein
MALNNEAELWSKPRVHRPRALVAKEKADVNALMQRCLDKFANAAQQPQQDPFDEKVLCHVRTIMFLRQITPTRDKSERIIQQRHVDAVVALLQKALHPQHVTKALYEMVACFVSLVSRCMSASRTFTLCDQDLFALIRHVLLIPLLAGPRFRLREDAVYVLMMLAHKNSRCRQELFEILSPCLTLDARHANIQLSELVLDISTTCNWGCTQCLRDVKQACNLEMIKSGRLAFIHDSKHATLSTESRDENAAKDAVRMAEWRSYRQPTTSSTSRVAVNINQVPASAGAKPPLHGILAMIPPMQRDQPLLPGEASRRPAHLNPPQRSQSTPSSMRAEGLPALPITAVKRTDFVTMPSVTTSRSSESTHGPTPSKQYSRRVWQEASRMLGPMQFLQPPPYPEDGLDPEEAYQLGRALLRQSAYLHNVSSLLLLACDRKEDSKILLDVVSEGLPQVTCQALHAGLQTAADMMQKVVAMMKTKRA